MNIGIIATQIYSGLYTPTIHSPAPNFDNAWYYETVGNTLATTVKPGDILEIRQNMTSIRIRGLKGTLERPITIRGKNGKWILDGSSAVWCMSLIDCQHIIIDGGDVTEGFIIGPAAGLYRPQTLTMNNCSDWEVMNCEIRHGEVGILGNPSIGTAMYNIKVHDNYIHDMRNPGATCEGIYLGNTSIQTVTGMHFENILIYNNDLDDLGGDGIQLANAQNYKIYNNTITNFGIGEVDNQESGLIIGSNSWGIVENNDILNGYGGGIQCFGTGHNIIRNNNIIGTALKANTDAIYIRRNGIDGDSLKIDVQNNDIDGATRHGVFHADNTAPRISTPGVWSGNTFANIGGQNMRSEIIPSDTIIP